MLLRLLSATLGVTLSASAAWSALSRQAGRKAPGEGAASVAMLNVIVEPPDPRLAPTQAELYDAGILQQIDYFRPDYSPARIVYLVDNSETLRASSAQLGDAVMSLANEMYEGDRAMVVGYQQRPDVLEEFTADKAKIKSATSRFQKVDFPRLLDALQATLNDALRMETGISKRMIFLFSDGYDRESGTTYPALVKNLQRDNIVVYAIKFEDRTRGAPRRKALKPEELLAQLTAGTGGRLIEAKQLASVARGVMKEIAEQWYQLAYHPRGINPLIARRLLLIPNERQIKLRTKTQQPPEQL